MRPEWRRALLAVVALVVASICAHGYARVAASYYAAVDRFVAIGYPWDILSVSVEPSDVSPGSVLRLVGDVRRHANDERPAARVVARVQVGEAVETPVVFWTMLLLWPAATVRQRLVRCALGLPIFLGLETITTAVQLIHNLPEASALLAGETDPITIWERWSRFLEGGGRFAVEVCAVLLTVAIASRLTGTAIAGCARIASTASARR